MGTHCDVSVNPCASNPCLYGGTCIPVSDDFICQCRGQYTGQRYVSMVHCINEPLGKQDINVTPFLFLFKCVSYFKHRFETYWNWLKLTAAPVFKLCIPHYEIACSKVMFSWFCLFCLCRCQLGPYCKDNPCKNSGKCIDSLDGPVCECEAGFRGER